MDTIITTILLTNIPRQRRHVTGRMASVWNNQVQDLCIKHLISATPALNFLIILVTVFPEGFTKISNSRCFRNTVSLFNKLPTLFSDVFLPQLATILCHHLDSKPLFPQLHIHVGPPPSHSALQRADTELIFHIAPDSPFLNIFGHHDLIPKSVNHPPANHLFSIFYLLLWLFLIYCGYTLPNYYFLPKYSRI